MKNKFPLFFICLLTTFFSLNSKGQNHEKITNSLVNYFKLDRENIYLHLNKDTYLTNETIWFKGYVLDKRTNKLNPQTTNVYVSLYDSDKKEIKKQLFYASNGTVLGQIKLDNSIASGVYFLHIYTNYMNNFKEDESTLEKVEIINLNDNIQKSKKNNLLNISLNYEGGKLLFNTTNTVSVYLTDCYNQGVSIQNAIVYDSNNNVVSKFSTNNQGYGKFDIMNTENTKYTIKINNDFYQLEQQLDSPVIEGINLSVNNYALNDKIQIKIKTNKNTLEKIRKEKMILLIQKNDFANYIDVNFDDDSTVKELLLDKSSLFKGINVIRLLDSNENSLTERVIYNHKKNAELTISTITKKGDSVIIKGNLPNRIASLSISTLPKNSISRTNENSILNTLQFKNSLNKNLKNSLYYFENFDRKKQYELDLFLIGCKSKYDWNSILKSSLDEKYQFELGLDLTGKLNTDVKSNNELRVNLFSYSGLNLNKNLNSQNEFSFNNLILIDSLTYHFSLYKKEIQQKITGINYYLKNNNSTFFKNITLENTTWNKQTSKSLSNDQISLFPKYEKLVQLDSISLSGEKKDKLINKSKHYSNSFSKSFKITEDKYNLSGDILSFIQSNGYDVYIMGSEVKISNRLIRSFNGSRSPLIYIDDVLVSDNAILIGMQLATIDEIYINKNGYGLGGNAANGAIRIYQKRGNENASSKNLKIKSKAVTFKNGFQLPMPFKNPNYAEYMSESFKNYATIDWLNNLYTNEKGEFEFTIPHYYQKELLLDLQGIDSEGDVHHKVITLNIK